MSEDLKCIMSILYSKTSFAEFKFYYVIFWRLLFLGYFLFFLRFHEVCVISTSQHFYGVFPLSPAQEMNKGAGFAL